MKATESSVQPAATSTLQRSLTHPSHSLLPTPPPNDKKHSPENTKKCFQKDDFRYQPPSRVVRQPFDYIFTKIASTLFLLNKYN
jgi:hypothetical protein